MSFSTARKTAGPLAAIAPIVALAIAAPPASAVLRDYAPSCAPPKGIVNVAHDFSSHPDKNIHSGGTNVLAEVWIGDDIKPVEPPNYFEPAGRVEVTYSEDPFLPKHYIPHFRQAVPMPVPEKIGGHPVVDYLAYITPYGKDGTAYSNADTHGTIYPDFGPRIYLAKTKVKAGRTARVTAMMRGFRDKVMYVHIVSSSGKVLRHVKAGRGEGDDTCGRRVTSVSLKGAKPGQWKLIVNTSRTSKSGGAKASIRLTR